jgi:hypothetical protein
MKSHRAFARLTKLAWAAALTGLPMRAPAAPGQAAAPAPAKTNPAASEPVISQSVFVMPTNPQEGRDPFFPRSTRPYAAAVLIRPNLTNAPPVLQLDLHLNGISGLAGKQLAIINGRSFEEGEEGDIISNGAHARIRCLEIKSDSAVVQIGAERRVLRLRSGI